MMKDITIYEQKLLPVLKKHAVVKKILTGLGILGVGATAYISARDTLRLNDALEDAKKKKEGAEMSLKEKIAVGVVVYTPTILTGAATIGCFAGAVILHRKDEASLTTGFIALENLFNRYRDTVARRFDPVTDELIGRDICRESEDKNKEAPLWNETQTFYINVPGYCRFFESTMEKVADAEFFINRNLVLESCVTFNHFLQLLGLDPIEGGNKIGWDDYSGEVFYGYRFIDFYHIQITNDEVSAIEIRMPFEPHPFDVVDSEYEYDPIPCTNIPALSISDACRMTDMAENREKNKVYNEKEV